MVLWEARPRPGNAAVELAGVIFGCLCLMIIAVVVLWVEFRQLQLMALTVVFGTALTLQTVGAIRGRVVLHPDGIEVRVLRTRRYPWSSLRSVDLVEGRIEITPDGWVRRLPIPGSHAGPAYTEILAWRARGAQAPPETR